LTGITAEAGSTPCGESRGPAGRSQNWEALPGQTGPVTDSGESELAWLRDHGYEEIAVAEAREWFRSDGWEVMVVERDLRDEMRARGEVYFPGFSHRTWVDLLRVDAEGHVVRNYASGVIEAEAVIRARQRYGSEQT